MMNQTILSGRCLNSDRAENVFHVITCMADPHLVGALPTEQLPIVLSGLQITGGSALHGEADEVGNVQSFYKGGGVMIDGTWGVAADERRRIILVAHACDFVNNRAGDGGAIYSNGVVEVYASSFAQNAAKYCTHSETAGANGDAEHGRGHGGAIFSDSTLTVVNSIFENNEAGAIENADDIPMPTNSLQAVRFITTERADW
jgi:predicted outer membrane repeat protein